jgi:hypothetical protein
MVPDSECSTPTLMVSAAKAGTADKLASATAAVSLEGETTFVA